MGKIRKGRSQRIEVATVSQDWVQSHRHLLTPRDIEMLKVLQRFPVMTIQHLYELTPPTYLKNGQLIEPFHRCKKGEQICRDRIRRLYDYHFVNKESPQLALGEGTSPQYVWLDRAGYKLLDIAGRPSKTLSSEYLHHARILDVYCKMTKLHRAGDIIMDYIGVCYTDKPKTANIEPDLIVCFRKGEYGYRYFIEVDNCEKKESEELNKLDRYRDWELGSQWIREDWASLYRRRFPTLLYLFSGSAAKVRRRISVFSERADRIECKGDFLEFSDFDEKINNLGI